MTVRPHPPGDTEVMRNNESHWSGLTKCECAPVGTCYRQPVYFQYNNNCSYMMISKSKKIITKIVSRCMVTNWVMEAALYSKSLTRKIFHICQDWLRNGTNASLLLYWESKAHFEESSNHKCNEFYLQSLQISMSWSTTQLNIIICTMTIRPFYRTFHSKIIIIL